MTTPVRSAFLAAASAAAVWHVLRPHISPRPSTASPDFTPCWLWTGSNQPGSKNRVRKKRRGQSFRFVTVTTRAKPKLHLTPLGTIDARRLCFELFNPSEGLRLYRLLPLPHCTSDLCINPTHFTPQTLPYNPDTTYPDFLPQNHPFLVHLIASFTPSATHIADDPFPPPVEAKIPLKIEIEENCASQTFGDAFGKPLRPNEFSEDNFNCPRTAFHVLKTWQVRTQSFAYNSTPQIQSWLAKWGDSIPISDTINLFSKECVEDAFQDIRAAHSPPYALSSILAEESYWFHPKLVLDWYDSLAPDIKQLIILTR